METSVQSPLGANIFSLLPFCSLEGLVNSKAYNPFILFPSEISESYEMWIKQAIFRGPFDQEESCLKSLSKARI